MKLTLFHRSWAIGRGRLLIVATAIIAAISSSRGADDVSKAVAAIGTAGSEGAGFDAAIVAARELQQLPSSEVLQILDGAAGANPIAENWIRGVVFGISNRSGHASVESLQAYVNDKGKNPIGRGIAMELIRQQDPAVAKLMIEECLQDDSLALREMAVEQAIGEARALEKSSPEKSIARFRAALEAARHPKQLARIVDALGKLGDQVTTAGAFSLITDWQASAPFDNVGGIGFNAEYGPETSFTSSGKIDLAVDIEGKNSSVEWRSVEGSEDEGIVDLAAAFNKEKGAVAYLYTEFQSPAVQPAEARLGCTNANKLWINGEEVMANEVYHSGSMLDQYTAPIQLLRGTNKILLKICQNEQEESWAQSWEFQFRLTDTTGKGLRSDK